MNVKARHLRGRMATSEGRRDATLREKIMASFAKIWRALGLLRSPPPGRGRRLHPAVSTLTTACPDVGTAGRSA